MKIFTKTLFAAAFAVASLFASDRADAATYHLGFALDRSGSIGSTDYGTAKTALANALDVIPVAGPDQYVVTVVSFASSVTTVVSSQVLTAANIGAVKAAINGDGYSGGGTFMSGAINSLKAQMDAYGAVDDSFINITTDGAPNSQNATTAAAAAALAAGINISAEAIGASNSTLVYLRDNVVGPNGGVIVNAGSIPDPRSQGFVIEVANIAAYEAAIAAKVQKIVSPIPVPAALPLMASGFGLFGFFGWRRRRQAAC